MSNNSSINLNSKNFVRSSHVSNFSAFSFYYPGCSDNFFSSNSILCSICLFPVGFARSRPDSCNHLFCSSCLLYWSKYRKTCPCCRKNFRQIISI